MIPRWVLIACGLLVAALGSYIILGEQFSGTSADSVINAQVLTLRAPIDGQLTLEVHELGARVGAKENLASLTDPRPDDTRLIDLQHTATQLTTELQRLRDQSAALDIARTKYQAQADTYLAGRVLQIKARIAEAASAMEGAQSKLRDSGAAFQRSSALGKSGFQSVADVGRARSLFEVGTQDVQATEERIHYLSVELEAAKQGTFLGDATNDAPYSQQRIEEIGLQLAEVAADVEERTQRIVSLRKQIDEEQIRLGRFTEARIDAPGPGILWEIMAGNGEYVRKAQEVLRIVDCTSTVVTASVRESVYNRLMVGDTAQFRLLSNSETYHGTVARLAGSGAQSIYRSLAIGPSEEHLKRFDVTLTIPALNADPALSCAVGRTGRVTFSAGPLQFWRHWLAEIGLI